MVKTLPSSAGVQVQSLVRELRSHVPRGQNTKHKPYCNKFNKKFKNYTHTHTHTHTTLKKNGQRT